MANNPYFSDATTIASVSAVIPLLNSGYLEIYNGLQPTDANTAVGSQVLLSSGMRFSSTAFATPVASGPAGSRVVTATANTITSDTDAIGGAGAATWFRAYKSDGVTGVMDGSVGTSGCDLNLNTTSIVAGATVTCTSFSITQLE